LKSASEHTGFRLQIITLMFWARQQFDGTCAVITALHQNSADACAGVFLARPLMPGDVAEMKMAHEFSESYYLRARKNPATWKKYGQKSVIFPTR
jgi:hypothetical protein